MRLSDSIWMDSEFREYAAYCQLKEYCNPWHPYVGDNYGHNEQLKFVYCGGSAWWESGASKPHSVESSRALTDKFVEQGELEDYSTPFWRLFDRLGALIHPVT